MSSSFDNSYRNSGPYIPETLSEIYDLLGSMILWAPTFQDASGYFPERNLDSRFQQLLGSFGKVRGKLGEERYMQLVDLARQAKALFADDPNDDNGKTDQGRALLFEIEGVIKEASKRRVAANLEDGDGEITGD